MGWASARKAWKDLVAREGCGGEEAEGEPETVEKLVGVGGGGVAVYGGGGEGGWTCSVWKRVRV